MVDISWKDEDRAIRYADIVIQINAKSDEVSRLMAAELMRKAREMDSIPTFGYCRPELHHRRKNSKIMRRAIKETRGVIRKQFGLQAE